MSEGIKNLFSKIPDKYDLINTILTFGLDHFWRKNLAKNVKGLNKSLILDVCTGTGRQIGEIKKKLNKEKKLFALDFCFPMLFKAKSLERIKLLTSDAKKMPFKDETFDIITISFATRNLNTSKESLKKTFKEFYRVLKKDGYFLNLETTQPPFFLFKFFLKIYCKTAVKPLGGFISSSKEAYSYLSHTIPRFYSALELKEILKGVGFSEVNFKYLFFFFVAIHISKK